LEPAPDGWAEHLAEHARDRHPAVETVGVFVAGYLALSAVMVALGLLLTHVLLDAGVGVWDQHISQWLADHRTGTLTDLTRYATYIANTEGVVAVATVVTVALLVARRRREASFVAGALILEFFVFLTVNYVVDRPRPDVLRLNDAPATSSFPSGHVAATIALWGSIAIVVAVLTTNVVLRVLGWIPVAVLTVTIGFARVYRGMHHMTDVVAGLVLGLVALTIACFAARVLTAAQRRRCAAAESRQPPLEAVGAR
jgi:membrane-associated phospholipid phosphatase